MERTVYVDKARLARDLAPPAPPCFDSRYAWLEYLAAAAEAQRASKPGPLIFEPGQRARFDPDFGYCGDCEMAYRVRMLKAGRCKPNAVRVFFAMQRVA